MEIPYQALSPDTLNNLIQELVTRDGTDYGDTEVSLQEKVRQVKLKLASGEAVIRYDEKLETCDIQLKND
ncbi:MAG: YheU family protein [Pseudomonadales bacterium]|nr:YheU family protein [Pseudomonadales bacterium]MCP5303126.1 YheU family protein [Pseudomonadales bacterium]